MSRILYTVLNGNIAGGQMSCLNTMIAAKNAGYEAVLLLHAGGYFIRLVEEMGVKVYIVPYKRSRYFHKILEIIKILKNEKIDLIHTNDSLPGNVLVRIAALFKNVPVLSHMHLKNYFSRNIISRIFARTLDNLTAMTCKKIIAVSEATKKDLIQQGYPSSKIEVIYTAPNRPAISDKVNRADLFSEFNIPRGSTIFLHVGRLCPSKGQAELIRAMQYILEDESDTYCLIVGEDQASKGSYKRVLEEKLTTPLMKDRIKFLGFRWDIDNLMAISDAVVLPSFEEGFPLSILEAMKNKKPVIAFTSDGILEEIEDSANGYLVKPGDIPGLKDAMLKIIRNPSKSKEMGLNGYRFLHERFDNEKYIKRILAIYENITAD